MKGIKFLPMLDVCAPGILVAQALGRWGNWFNQELYGRPTDLPWGLEIDPEHWPPDATFEAGTTFHPTFLYESLWNVAAFFVVLWLERRFRLGYGRVMAVYVMAYTLGRAWIEYLRIDEVQYDDVLGLRFNVWTSIALFVAAAIYVYVSARRHPGREEDLYLPGRGPTTDAGTDESPEGADEDRNDEADEAAAPDESTEDEPAAGKASTDD
jgi:prolipoprotein diacylglyceryl transferase